MAAVLTLILWLLALALAVLAVLLVTPTLVSVRVATRPRLTWQVHLRLLGGLAPRIALTGNTRRKAPKAATRPERPAPRPGRRGGGARFLSGLPRLALDILGAIRLRSLRVDCDFGLDDPADTGRIAGLLMPVHYAAALPANLHLALRPDFTRRRFTGEVTALFSVTPAAVLPPMLRFAWHGARSAP